MGKHWCLNGTMVDTDRYSSPVPFIGLYTATATSVCLILILCDIWLGFRRKKSWFPCRFFSLNSITLTLLSISVKLPVDLTSPMPSSQDQLSKLTGTIFICLTMAFLIPSTATIGEIESYSNMVALSIFVITVIVNICVQMATGVIFSFIPEHAIILFCMFILLVSLWIAAFGLNDYKEVHVDDAAKILKFGPEESLFERIRVCYLEAYTTDPQFNCASRSPICAFVSFICAVCVAILAEVLIRSLGLKDPRFCAGVSAYGWSVWSVVATQVVSIVVLSFAVGGRWLKYADHISNFKKMHDLNHDTPYLVVAYSFYVPLSLHSLADIYRLLVIPCINLILFFVIFVSQTIGGWMRRTRCMSRHDNGSIEGYKRLLEAHNVYTWEWELREAVEDMKKLIQLNTAKHPQMLMNLLSTTDRNHNSVTVQVTCKVSCLSILLLVEMAKLSIPNSLTTTMMENIMAEVFPLVYFVDSKKRIRGFDSKVKSLTAKILFTGKATSGVRTSIRVESVQSQSELARALGLIRAFFRSFVDRAVRHEGKNIVNFFTHREHLYASLDELSDDIKLLFVDMLRALLSQLPVAIFDHVVESPQEKYNERVRYCLKYLCQVELLESYVIWSFPTGSNITGLINAQPPATDTQSNNSTGNISVLIDSQSLSTANQRSSPAGDTQINDQLS